MAIRGTAIGRQAGDEASRDVVTRGAIQPLLIHPTSPIWTQTAGDDCRWGLRDGHLSYRWKTWMLTCWPKKIGSYEIASCNTVEILNSSTRNAQAHDTLKEGGGPYV